MSRSSDFRRIMRRENEKARRSNGDNKPSSVTGNSGVATAISTPKTKMDNTIIPDDASKGQANEVALEAAAASLSEDDLDIDDETLDVVVTEDSEDGIDDDASGAAKVADFKLDIEAEDFEDDEPEDVFGSGVAFNTKVSDSLKKEILRIAKDILCNELNELKKENLELARRVKELEGRIAELEEGDTESGNHNSGSASSVIRIYEISSDTLVNPSDPESIRKAEENAIGVTYFIKK